MTARLLTKWTARPGRINVILLAVCAATLGWTLTLLATAQAAGHASTGQATASTAALSLEPSPASILVSDTLTVNIVVSGVVDLYGAELVLTFDPDIVSVVDHNLGTDGVQISPGSCPSANFVAQNVTDNVSGIISYAVTSLAPAAPCSGTGTVASITFQGLAPGITPISFTNWLLSDSSIQTINTTVSDGLMAVELPPGIVQGAATLQGRADNGGVAIAIWNSDGWPSTSLTSTVTGADGAYALNIPAGSYTVTVEMDGYLDAMRPSVVVEADGLLDLPGLDLPCGDPNDDDLVNIQDLTILGSRYRLVCGDPGWDSRADMINDCVVNILDLTCAGANYGRTSPVNWP